MNVVNANQIRSTARRLKEVAEYGPAVDPELARVTSAAVGELALAVTALDERMQALEQVAAGMNANTERLTQRVYGDRELGVQGMADVVASVEALTAQLHSLEHLLDKLGGRINWMLVMGVVVAIGLAVYIFGNLILVMRQFVG